MQISPASVIEILPASNIRISETRELLIDQLTAQIQKETDPLKRLSLEWRLCFFNTCCSTDGYGLRPGCCLSLKTKCIKYLSNCLGYVEWAIRRACRCCFRNEPRLNQILPSPE